MRAPYADEHAEVADSGFGRAFAIQYLSLMLIVLTFVVGALARPQPAARSASGASLPVEPLALSAPQAPSSEMPIGRMPLTELFVGGGDEIAVARADAIAHVLKSHDIYAEIELYDDGVGEGMVLARAIALSRHLGSRQVAFDTFRVLSSSAAGESAVTFTRLTDG